MRAFADDQLLHAAKMLSTTETRGIAVPSALTSKEIDQVLHPLTSRLRTRITPAMFTLATRAIITASHVYPHKALRCR